METPHGQSSRGCMPGGEVQHLPPRPPPALRFLIWNSTTLFGFVFVAVSCCLWYCSSFVVACGLLLLVILFVIMFVILFFCYMVSYMMLFLVVFLLFFVACLWFCCEICLVKREQNGYYGKSILKIKWAKRGMKEAWWTMAEIIRWLCKMQRGNDLAWWTLWVRFLLLFVIPNHEL